MIGVLRRVYRELDWLIEAAGHGSKTRIQTAAGLGESYIRNLRDRLAAGQDKRYDLAALLRMLEVLRVDGRVFFGKVFGTLDPIELTQLETHQLGEPPELVGEVKDLLRLEGWRPPAEPPEHARQLDAHRYQDAVSAARFARTELEKVAVGLRPSAEGVPLLAVYGSALRMTDDFDGAQQTLVAALEVAEPIGDEVTLGDLLQRLAYAVADRCGDYRRALRLSERAMIWLLQAGDMNAVGKTFVDRGLWQYKLGRFEEAIRSQRRALELLEADEHRNRFSAFQGLGLYYRKLGDLEQAHEHASAAAELAPHVGTLLAAKLLRLRARIAVDRCQLANAEEYLREVIEAFLASSGDEAAASTVELVRVLLLQDRADEARELAKTMVQFIVPLEDRSVTAASAVLELLKRAQAGQISVDLVDRVAGVLENEWARPHGRTHSRR